MEKEFIPYEEALALKELGFNELCLYAWCEIGGRNKYTGEVEEIIQVLKTDGNPFGLITHGQNWNREMMPNTKSKIQCSAPLYQQAFRWFREKHSFHSQVEIDNEEKWTFSIYNLLKLNSLGVYGDQSKTHEEAELACLRKLIEIVKNDKP